MTAEMCWRRELPRTKVFQSQVGKRRTKASKLPPQKREKRSGKSVCVRNRLRTQSYSLVPSQRTGGPHISLVFREMRDTTKVDRRVGRVHRESEGKSSGIPHLAKNERDVGHPSFVREPVARPTKLGFWAYDCAGTEPRASSTIAAACDTLPAPRVTMTSPSAA